MKHIKQIINSRYSGSNARPKISFLKSKSLTKQSMRDECNVNQIMKKFETTGQLPESIKSDPKYGDFSEMESYQESLNIVAHANEQFSQLSSKIRKRFSNDPAEFLEFATNSKNHDEMISLGLADKPPIPPRTDSEGNPIQSTAPAQKAPEEAAESVKAPKPKA